MRRGSGRVLLIALVLLMTACVRHPDQAPKERVWRAENALVDSEPPPLQHPGNGEALQRAMGASIDYYRALPEDTVLGFGPRQYSVRDLLAFLEDILSRLEAWGPNERFMQYLSDRAVFLESAADSVLVTGYYEIRLKGALSPTGTSRHPVYQRPPDLVQIPLKRFLTAEYSPTLPDLLRGRLTPEMEVVPHYSRHEIDRQQLLRDKNLELCWVDDPYRLFFLHIQGSGVVELEDGREISLNYDGSNGHAYRSIGRTLIDRFGVDSETLSMQGIYAFLKNNPQLADEILDSNPSYVFFRQVPKGPIGSLGRALTPMCSIATDYRLFPKGAMAYLESELPEFDEHGRVTGWKATARLVMNQDTGGAIRGAGRVDWFIGSDRAAELTAGHLKQRGRLFFLAPKNSTIGEK